jgi:hypothetical protein
MSSASIPAVSFVIAVTMPARGHQRKQVNPIDSDSSSGFADSRRQSQIKQKYD